jgi:tetratricopeptide (TPR) repeat protein
MIDYAQVCFVIMPFGKKRVGSAEVDFDAIYDNIFAPAIGRVVLPEGRQLKSRRTDKDFFTADINNEMFSYIEYARFAIADISGLNANVFYELGARHHTRESGTAIFRQAGATVPFDIQTIKAFSYEYGTPEKDESARTLISRVLTESLANNRIDSPIRLALDHQQQQGDAVQVRLKDAENAIHCGDTNRAIQLYKEVIAIDLSNPLHRMKLGLLQKEQGMWSDAIAQFNSAVGLSGRYAEAWREKGIAENKLAFRFAGKTNNIPQANPAPGEADLRRAIELNASDFDAHAALGGVLKRAGRYDEAWRSYQRAREVSNDHPYPLLNEIKLRAFLNKKLDLTGDDRRALMRAERIRQLQTSNNPPYDSPWCFFDLAEIRLYAGKRNVYVALIDQGIKSVTESWQPATVRNGLSLLKPAAASLPGLEDGLKLLDDYLRP